MIRVYLPATLGTLATAYVAGHFESGYAAHAVTPAVREWYVEGDTEELEYVAMREAADSSLRLLAGELAAEARYENCRVVVAADVDPSCLTPHAGDGALARSSVRLICTVPLTSVVSVHVDEDAPSVRSAVAAAIRSLPAADGGDDDAAFVVGEARSHELLWFDASELVDLI